MRNSSRNIIKRLLLHCLVLIAVSCAFISAQFTAMEHVVLTVAQFNGESIDENFDPQVRCVQPFLLSTHQQCSTCNDVRALKLNGVTGVSKDAMSKPPARLVSRALPTDCIASTRSPAPVWLEIKRLLL